jgi:nitrite reductase/ring-hydroxylating ferredoxin subunit/uncharacterized membrane protein
MALEKDLRDTLDDVIKNREELHQASVNAAQSLHDAILEHGEDARAIADVLHGKALGHPLHPVLTDLTLGSWTLGVFFDVVALATESRAARRTGNQLVTLGTLFAIPTAVTGLADYSTIKKEAASYGAAHGLLNGLAFLCFARSTIARLGGYRSTALFYSLTGMMIATFSAWLGGDLVYRHRVGVNHAPAKHVDDWLPVLDDNKLPDATLTRVELDGQPILLFRQGDQIYSIGAVCSHAGGPLEQGELVNDLCVQCPWHQSVFDLRDGHIVHAPATTPQPRYLARVRNGQIEVCSWTREKAAQPTASLYDASMSEPEVLHSEQDFNKVDNPPSQAEGERE